LTQTAAEGGCLPSKSIFALADAIGKTAGNTYLYCRDSYGNEVKCLLKIKG
jgi:hypothetical protein